MAAPRKQSQQSAVRTVLYDPTTQNNLEIRAKTCLEIRVISSCCTDPYSTTSHSRKNNLATKHKFFPWDLFPSSLGKRALFAAHFPLSSLLRKSLSISSRCDSMCLAHYPMHSFINLKMTFSLQSVFSHSPTLNPKAKIRSCLFQDQGS
jgi:hypothetical protein